MKYIYLRPIDKMLELWYNKYRGLDLNITVCPYPVGQENIMKKADAVEIARLMQENFKPKTACYFADEYKGDWRVSRRPIYGSQEYIELHTIHWKDEFSLIMYLIGYVTP